MYVSLNKRVAVEPFPEAPKAEVKNGVLQPMNAAALTPLKVVFDFSPEQDAKGILAGSTVLVRSNLKKTSSYGKEVFEAEGKRFILLPLEEVLLVQGPSLSGPSMPVTEEPGPRGIW